MPPAMPATILVVMPALFASAHERRFFAARPELLEGLLRTVEEIPAQFRLAVAAEEHFPLPTPKSGTETTVIRLPIADRPRTQAYPFDDPGLQAALAAVPPREGEHVLCLDIRQPFVTAADLKEAWSRYRQAAAPVLISVLPVRDHPCQAFRSARVVEQGLIHLFEQEPVCLPGLPKDLPHRVGRHFPLDQTAVPAGPSGSLWTVTGTMDAMRLLAPEQAEQALFFIRRETAERARLFVRLDRLTDTPAAKGAAVSGTGTIRPVFADPTGRLVVSFAPQAETSLVLTAPFAASGPAGEAERHLLAPDTDRLSLPAGPDGCHGWVYSRLALVSGGAYDLNIPVSLRDAAWDFDRAGRLIHTATGRLLLGRQDFPPVLTREPGPILFPRSIPPAALPERIASGQALAHCLTEPALILDSAQDFALAACRLEVIRSDMALSEGIRP